MRLCQGRKTARRTLVVTLGIAHCSDRNTVCLKDLTFLFIRQVLEHILVFALFSVLSVYLFRCIVPVLWALLPDFK